MAHAVVQPLDARDAAAELVGEPLSEVEAAFLQQLARDALARIRVSDTLAQQVAGVSPAAAAHLARSDNFWRDMENEWGLLTAADVADRAGSRSKNRRAYANQHRANGSLLGLDRAGRTLFPGFQLDADGRIRPGIRPIAEIFRAEGWTDRAILLWLASATGLLNGARPVDLLDDDPSAVLEAAMQAAPQYVG